MKDSVDKSGKERVTSDSRLLYHFDVLSQKKMSTDPCLNKAIMISPNMVLGISVEHPRAAFYLLPTDHFFETFGKKDGVTYFNDVKDKICQNEPKLITEEEFPSVVQRINAELLKLVH